MISLHGYLVFPILFNLANGYVQVFRTLTLFLQLFSSNFLLLFVFGNRFALAGRNVVCCHTLERP